MSCDRQDGDKNIIWLGCNTNKDLTGLRPSPSGDA